MIMDYYGDAYMSGKDMEQIVWYDGVFTNLVVMELAQWQWVLLQSKLVLQWAWWCWDRPCLGVCFCNRLNCNCLWWHKVDMSSQVHWGVHIFACWSYSRQFRGCRHRRSFLCVWEVSSHLHWLYVNTVKRRGVIFCYWWLRATDVPVLLLVSVFADVQGPG